MLNKYSWQCSNAEMSQSSETAGTELSLVCSSKIMDTDLVARLKLYARQMEEELALAREAKEHYSRLKDLLDGLKKLRVAVASKAPLPDDKSIKDYIFKVYNQIDHILAVASPECPRYQCERGPENAIRDYSRSIQIYERMLRGLYELFPGINTQETTIRSKTVLSTQ